MKQLILIATLALALFPWPAQARTCGWRYVGRVTYHGQPYLKYQSTCYINLVKLVPTRRF